MAEPVAGGITQRKEFRSAVAAVEQERPGLLRSTPGTLTRRHVRNVPKRPERTGDPSAICGKSIECAPDRASTLALMIIGFDADDTLWHNEDAFQASHREFEALLADYGDPHEIEDHLFEIESRNMPRYGYGVKAYTLSLIECAIDISDGRVSTAQIASVLDLGHALLDRPVELIDGVEDALDVLGGHTKMIITKGDLYHQLSRIETSGLAHHFWQTEVVAHKDPATYTRVLGLHGIDPRDFVMVGNSLPSDVLPVMAIGGRAVHVPYHVTWTHELHDGDHDAPTLEHLGELPDLLADWGLR